MQERFGRFESHFCEEFPGPVAAGHENRASRTVWHSRLRARLQARDHSDPDRPAGKRIRKSDTIEYLSNGVSRTQ